MGVIPESQQLIDMASSYYDKHHRVPEFYINPQDYDDCVGDGCRLKVKWVSKKGWRDDSIITALVETSNQVRQGRLHMVVESPLKPIPQDTTEWINELRNFVNMHRIKEPEYWVIRMNKERYRWYKDYLAHQGLKNPFHIEGAWDILKFKGFEVHLHEPAYDHHAFQWNIEWKNK